MYRTIEHHDFYVENSKTGKNEKLGLPPGIACGVAYGVALQRCLWRRLWRSLQCLPSWSHSGTVNKAALRGITMQPLVINKKNVIFVFTTPFLAPPFLLF